MRIGILGLFIFNISTVGFSMMETSCKGFLITTGLDYNLSPTLTDGTEYQVTIYSLTLDTAMHMAEFKTANFENEFTTVAVASINGPNASVTFSDRVFTGRFTERYKDGEKKDFDLFLTTTKTKTGEAYSLFGTLTCEAPGPLSLKKIPQASIGGKWQLTSETRLSDGTTSIVSSSLTLLQDGTGRFKNNFGDLPLTWALCEEKIHISAPFKQKGYKIILSGTVDGEKISGSQKVIHLLEKNEKNPSSVINMGETTWFATLIK